MCLWLQKKPGELTGATACTAGASTLPVVGGGGYPGSGGGAVRRGVLGAPWYCSG